MALQTITKDILTRTSGAALLELPYDISFLAGYDADTEPDDAIVKKYGELVMARPGIFVGEVGYIDVLCTGQALICDVKVDSGSGYSSIYSSKPQFVAGSFWISPGTLSTTSFASGDRVRFEITQIGSSAPGQGIRFMLKCKV